MKNIFIPPKVGAVLRKLNDASYEAYLVGGCVRDQLLGLTPHDWDVATSATPEQVMALFPHSVALGYGTVLVIESDQSLEVTTFRAEGDYADSRHPDSVTFVSDLPTDIARRDFTVNALAASARGEVTDLVGGIPDLEKGLIRAVGDPSVRFAARYGWEIEPETARAMHTQSHLCASLSGERIHAEIDNTLSCKHPEYIARLFACGALGGIFPVTNEEIRSVPFTLLSEFEPSARLSVLFALLYDRTSADLTGAFRALRLSRAEEETLVGFMRAFTAPVCHGRAEWARLLSGSGEKEIRLSLQLKKLLYELGHDPRFALAEEQGYSFASALAAGGLTRGELAVTGGELEALGLSGADIGKMLTRLYNEVVEDPSSNKKETLLALARQWMIE